MNLIKGQKADVTKNNQGLNIQKISTCLGWSASNSLDVDASVFMVGANGKIVSEADFVFYGQTTSSCKSVQLRIPQKQSGQKQFDIILKDVPQNVKNIVFALTIDSSTNENHTFGDVTNIYLKILFNSEVELLIFPISEGFSKETAIVLGELYRYNANWKFNSIGAGYFGGLSALCKEYGVDVQEDTAPPPKPEMATKPTPTPPTPVKITKIELKKKEAINIKKSSSVTATLEWNTNKDLDLYCFYVTKDNQLGKVYYKNLGNKNTSPHIELDGDSKTNGCETIRIHKPADLKFVLFAAYSAVENGTGSFYSMRAKAVVDNHMGDIVTAPLLEENNLAYWVAIAKIDFTNEKEMKVEHVERYSKSHSEKSPLLYADGTFQMDVGPEEFKTNKSSLGGAISSFFDLF
jgi:stress response protein SCP2